MSDIVKMPIPPIPGPGGKVEKIIKIVKAIYGIIKGNPSKKIKDADSVNDNSSVENIDYIMQGLTGFKESVNSQIKEIEITYNEELETYFDELKEIMSEKQDSLDRYGIKFDRVERSIEKILERGKGNLEFEVSKKLSLDNPELRNILKMIPGTKKEEALDVFFKNVLQEALSDSCEKMKSDIREVCDEVEDMVLGTIELVKNNCENQTEKLEQLNSEDNKAQMKTVICDGYYNLFACELVEQLMMEG